MFSDKQINPVKKKMHVLSRYHIYQIKIIMVVCTFRLSVLSNKKNACLCFHNIKLFQYKELHVHVFAILDFLSIKKSVFTILNLSNKKQCMSAFLQS